ncbi:hypothetical protein [Treponema primitia]|uniref:hypothetical protein n=1 Tax=Treponema primitia TaxID=88058 RepID=UPI0002E8C468|nr:hypothetical protein [Treponema primitia]
MNKNKLLAIFVFQLFCQNYLLSQTQPENYVFFNLDRELIRNASFYDFRQFAGAQIKYTWRSLEREKDVYDFSTIEEDRLFLLSKGKKLFIQIQDVSFSSNIRNVPNYIIEDPQYHGGINSQYEFADDNDNNPRETGWVSRRWDRAVAERFHKLIMELGKQFDGKIIGITLPETSVDFGSTGKYYPIGFTPEIYREAIKANMNATHLAFNQSMVIQYVNFMPGEWLPWDDKGYLSSLFEYAELLKIGIGGPDLIPYKRNQMNHGYSFAQKYQGRIKLGFAVQEGNYNQKNEQTGWTLTVQEIYDFAKNYLKTNYIFWYPEEPYFTRDVKPLLLREIR